jgi:hypothetical protein
MNLKRGELVRFSLADGLVCGLAQIEEVKYDGGWFYRLDVIEGDTADIYRNERGELWPHDEQVKQAWFLNHYRCSDCGETWSDAWSCTCNDRCPNCDTETEPYESEDATV